MKQKAVDNVYMDKLDMRDKVNTRPEPSEELEPVQLDDNPEHLAYIGSRLAEDLRHLLRSFAPERQKAINEEVGKLLQAEAIKEMEYPEWLANIVLVKKANGKWRLCIDFTDIN